LLRHLRGPVIVVWDRGRQHRARVTQDLVARFHHRLSIEWLPAYAPELNPDEHVWSLLKYHRLANHGYRHVGLLHRRLHYHVGRVRREQDLLWSCIQASELSLRRLEGRH
jgi:transposase